MAKFTDLTPIIGSNMTNDYVFAVSTSSQTRSLTLDELEQSFTGITAKSTNGISIMGRTVPSGVTVSDDGFVGVGNVNPSFSLHVGDFGANTNPEFRITGYSSGRSVATTISDENVYWRNIKKANDKDYYLEISEDDVSFTGVLNIDTSGNIGLFDGSFDLSDKFYVSGGNIRFENKGTGIIFDPQKAEIKTSISNDIFSINKSNTDDIVLGNDIVYVVNNPSSPAVGIGSTSPSSPLEVVGSNTILNLENTSTTRSRIRLGNNTSTAWFTIDSTSLNIGPVGTNSSSNIIYDLSNKNLGVGTSSVDNRLHVYTNTSNRLVKFETQNSENSEIFQTNNYNGDGVSFTGPRNSIYTFARSVGSSSFTNNVSKWGIGLYDDGETNTYEDVFVFRQNADTSSNNSIKAYLDTQGNFDIKGSFSTSGDYSQGKFIEVFNSRVTGLDIYIDPFSYYSSEIASGISGGKPFGVAPYSGEIKKVKLISYTDNVSDLISTNGHRFEIYKTQPDSGVLSGYVSGFEETPSGGAAATFPTSGIIGQFSLDNIISPNLIYSFESDIFSGLNTFDEGDYVQYRICDSTGSKPTGIDFEIISHVSFTIN